MARRRSRRIRWLAVALVAVTAGCGSDEPTVTDTTLGEPSLGPSGDGAFTGTASSGADVVVSVSEAAGVIVSWSEMTCEGSRERTDTIENLIDPFDAVGIVSAGELRAEGTATNNGLDGDTVAYEVLVTGTDKGGGLLEGSIEVRKVFTNGQGSAMDDDYEPSVCSSGALRWTATQTDDPAAAALAAFRAAANDDVDAVRVLLDGGLPPDVRHPIRGTTLTANIARACVQRAAESELGWERGTGDDRREFPSSAAADTVAALVDLGVPSPTASDGSASC